MYTRTLPWNSLHLIVTSYVHTQLKSFPPWLVDSRFYFQVRLDQLSALNYIKDTVPTLPHFRPKLLNSHWTAPSTPKKKKTQLELSNVEIKLNHREPPIVFVSISDLDPLVTTSSWSGESNPPACAQRSARPTPLCCTYLHYHHNLIISSLSSS